MVDIQRIFDVGMKGMNLIQSLAQQGKDLKPTITALTNVFSKRPDQVSDEELDKTEEQLDQMLDDFEQPMTKLKR